MKKRFAEKNEFIDDNDNDNDDEPAIVGGHLDVESFEVAADGLAEVLAHDADHRAGEEYDDAALVKEFEEPVVDGRLVELEILGDVAQKMRHLLK